MRSGDASQTDAPGVTAVAGRRLVNLQIVQCPSPAGGVCRQITKLGVAQYFMPVKADITGKKFYLEFVKQITLSAQAGKVRLYQ